MSVNLEFVQPKWLSLFQSSGFEGALHFDEPLSKHTFYKIGGPAALVAVPKTSADLEILARNIQSAQIPFFILGLGSNILAADEPSPMLYIKMTQFGLQAEAGPSEIVTGPGVTVASFLRRAATEGWDGFEFMSGIPGTLGGVVAMNGGTHLGEAASMIESVSTFSFANRNENVYSPPNLKFSYRKNHFLKPGELVTQIRWKLKPGDPTKIRELLDTLYRRRKETQPLDFPSCGSVFKILKTQPFERGKSLIVLVFVDIRSAWHNSQKNTPIGSLTWVVRKLGTF
jgi:UDP-N-acetylmuramate dehydrogenase